MYDVPPPGEQDRQADRNARRHVYLQRLHAEGHGQCSEQHAEREPPEPSAEYARQYPDDRPVQSWPRSTSESQEEKRRDGEIFCTEKEDDHERHSGSASDKGQAGRVCNRAGTRKEGHGCRRL